MKIKKPVIITASLILLGAVSAAARCIYMRSVTPDEYMIQTENTPEYQSHVECAGYSAAYVLRHFGENAHGLEMYNEIDTKNENGTVNPDAVIRLLKKKGYKGSIKLGSINSLKYYISKGTPVIILCREKPGSQYLHYMAVVGYDKEHIYASDSLDYMVNASDPHYNRSVSLDDLEQMWDIGYPVKNIYITVRA